MNKRTKIWLLVALCMGLLCLHAYADETGTCGEGAMWVLDDSGVLTISGTGEVEAGPWNNTQKVRKLIVEEGVTAIGDYAFEKCWGLSSVQLAESVTRIGEGAFGKCYVLRMELPGNIEYIGKSALRGNPPVVQSLSSKTADTLVEAGYGMVSPENENFKVTIEEKDGARQLVLMDYIGYETEVVIPAEIDSLPVTTLGSSFINSNNELIKSVTLSESIREIRSGTLGGQALSIVDLPDNISQDVVSSVPVGSIAIPINLRVTYGSLAQYYAEIYGKSYVLRPFALTEINAPETVEVPLDSPVLLKIETSPEVDISKFETPEVLFASEDESVATVSSTGLIRGVAPGETNITVRDRLDPSVQATVRVTVVKKVWSKPHAKIELSSQDSAVDVKWIVGGGEEPLKVTQKIGSEVKTYYDVTTTTGEMTWEGSTAVAPKTLKTLLYTLTVEDASGESVTATAHFDRKSYYEKVGETSSYQYTSSGGVRLVKTPVYDYVWRDTCTDGSAGVTGSIKSISVNASVAGSPGYVGALGLTVVPSAYSGSVFIANTNPEVAEVDDDGSITLKAVGSSVITVYATDGSGRKAQCFVSCRKNPATGVTAIQAGAVDEATRTQQLSASVLPNYADVRGLRWSSSDNTIASVSDTGLVRWYDAGTVVFTAAAVDPNGGQKTIELTWDGILIKELSLSLSEDYLDLIEWTTVPENVTNRKVTFTVSDPALAEVREDGYIRFKGEGSVTVTATAQDKGGATATLEVYAHEHVPVAAEPYVEPTCEEPGWSEHIVCEICGSTFEPRTEIAPLGHNYAETVIAPTCESEGYTAQKCSRCGDEQRVEGSEVAALGHSYKSGVCERCDGHAPAYDVALAHNWTFDQLVAFSGMTEQQLYALTEDSLNSLDLAITEYYADYVVVDGALVRYNGSDANVVIPADLNIGAIGGAFTGRTDIVSVEVPGTTYRIAANAFEGCTGLKNLIIPASVAEIGENAIPAGVTIYTAKGSAAATWGEAHQCVVVTDFTIENGVLTGYSGSDTIVIVPSNAGIRTIGKAFAKKTNIQYVTLPDGVKTIASGAFAYCSGLKSMDIPASVRVIEDTAFYYCSSMSTLKLREGLESIGDSAFSGCGLMTLDIPDSVVSLGNSAFAFNAKLMTVEVGKNVPAVDRNTFAVSSTANDYLQSVTFNGPTELGTSAFNNRPKLMEVVMTEGVTAIPGNAFYNCKALKELNLPSTITSVGDNAFYACNRLEITLPYGLKTVGTQAFYGCSLLDSIPQSVTSVGASAFRSTGIKSVIVPAAWGEIPMGLFQTCVSLESVTIEDGITGIGNSAFANCSKLTEIYIPSSVTTISTYAFKHCDSLKRLTLPEGVGYLGSEVFSYCGALETLTMPESLNYLGSSLLGNCSALKTIYCVKGSYADTWLTRNKFTDKIVYICSADEHRFSYSNEIEPDCERTGSRDRVCAICGYTENEVLPALGHDVVIIPDEPALCEQDGWTEPVQCRACGKVLAEGRTIPALGHDWGEPVYTWSEDYATVTATRACKRSEGHVESETVKSTGEVLKEASDDAPGSRRYIAVFTNPVFSRQVKLVEIPALYRKPTMAFNIPAGMSAIGDESFRGIAAASVLVPDDVKSIGKAAFADCPNLTKIYIPVGVTRIDDTAFDHCPGTLTIIGAAGSTAETFAGAHGFGFIEELEYFRQNAE